MAAFSRGLEVLVLDSSKRASRRSGKSRRTIMRKGFSKSTGPRLSDFRILPRSSAAAFLKRLRSIARLSPAAIPALFVRGPGLAVSRDIPTYRDTSLPWSDDFALHGWSAKMFLHQMLSNSSPHWKCSDTDSLLSNSTVAILRVRVAKDISVSDVLLTSCPSSSELFLTRRMILDLAKRAVKNRRRLQRVLLRTRTGWRRSVVIVSSRGGGFGFSLAKSEKPCKDSPEAGLLAYLEDAVACYSATR